VGEIEGEVGGRGEFIGMGDVVENAEEYDVWGREEEYDVWGREEEYDVWGREEGNEFVEEEEW
jgi:hypothetical protein